MPLKVSHWCAHMYNSDRSVPAWCVVLTFIACSFSHTVNFDYHFKGSWHLVGGHYRQRVELLRNENTISPHRPLDDAVGPNQSTLAVLHCDRHSLRNCIPWNCFWRDVYLEPHCGLRLFYRWEKRLAVLSHTYTLDCFLDCFLDIMVNFNLAYMNHDGTLIDARKVVRWHYSRTCKYGRIVIEQKQTDTYVFRSPLSGFWSISYPLSHTMP